MRLSLPLLLPALACLAQADSGKLYIYDGHLQSTSAESNVSPETARLILASRLGLDEFHALGNVDQDTIDAINHLSAHRHLFAASSEASVAVLLGEGVNQKGMLYANTLHQTNTSIHAALQKLTCSRHRPEDRLSPLPDASDRQHPICRIHREAHLRSGLSIWHHACR